MVTVRADAVYCSTRGRVAGNRRAKRNAAFPDAMRERASWTRADGKRPIRVDGSPASSTDARTWAALDAVQRSTAGDGVGFMLGDGMGCYDLDHVTDIEAREMIGEIPEPILYIERSLSGSGVHVFVEAPECAGTKSWQGRHERYTRERFIRVTGVPFS